MKRDLLFPSISFIINKYAGVAEWQTHRTQNATGNRAGSSPATGTKTRFIHEPGLFMFFEKMLKNPFTFAKYRI